MDMEFRWQINISEIILKQWALSMAGALLALAYITNAIDHKTESTNSDHGFSTLQHMVDEERWTILPTNVDLPYPDRNSR